MSTCNFFQTEAWTRLYEETVTRVAAQDNMTEEAAVHVLPDPPESCDRPADESGLCAFHRPSSTTDDSTVVKELVDEWSSTDGESTVFGLRATEVDLSRTRVGTELADTLWLPYARVERLSLAGAMVESPLDLTAAELGDITLAGATLSGRLTTSYALIQGRTDLSGTTFENPWVSIRSQHNGKCRLNDAEFEGRRTKLANAVFNAGFSADHARFDRVLECPGTRFSETARFSETRFDRVNMKSASFVEARFRDAVVERRFAFGETTVDEELNCYGSRFHGRASFDGMEVGGETGFRRVRFTDDASFADAVFAGPTEFDGARFAEGADFSSATFPAGASFLRTEFERRLDFKAVESTHLLDFRNATVTDGVISTVDAPPIDCSGATLGTVVFERDETPSLADVALAGTDYAGFDFARYASTLEPDWRLRTEAFAEGYDDPPRSETYLRARNAASDAGNRKASAELFLREMRSRRQEHRQRSASASTPWTGLTARVKWLKSWAFDLSCGYGERPGNTVVVSVGVIVVYAAAYVATIGGTLFDNLLFSLQTFVAFLFGDIPRASGWFVELLTASEAFFGGFVIALFVFALTRSVHR